MSEAETISQGTATAPVANVQAGESAMSRSTNWLGNDHLRDFLRAGNEAERIGGFDLGAILMVRRRFGLRRLEGSVDGSTTSANGSRELVGFVARPDPLCGENIRDMMVQAVESRFGAGTRKLPTTIQWLSDNGSIYTSNGQVLQRFM